MKYPIPYRNKDKWGFCNQEKTILISCIYDDVVLPFSDENFQLSLVKIREKKCWINSFGQQVSPLSDTTFPFTDKEISVVILDDDNVNTLQSVKNCLFLNKSGQPVFEIDAITANGFQNDFCIILFPNQKYGAINSLGETIIEPQFDDISSVWEKMGSPYPEYIEHPKSLIKFKLDLYFGYKDPLDTIKIEPIYMFARDFSEETTIVAIKPKLFHHINNQGERLYDKNYYFGLDFYNDIAKVVTDRHEDNPFKFERWGVDYYIPETAKWGYIDKQGNEYWND